MEKFTVGLFIVLSIVCLKSEQAFSQNNKAAFYSGTYRNIFHEAGYKQADIDKKINQV